MGEKKKKRKKRVRGTVMHVPGGLGLFPAAWVQLEKNATKQELESKKTEELIFSDKRDFGITAAVYQEAIFS